MLISDPGIGKGELFTTGSLRAKYAKSEHDLNVFDFEFLKKKFAHVD